MSESEVNEREANLHSLVTMDTGSLSREVTTKHFYFKFRINLA
jgi:hypothetical protein